MALPATPIVKINLTGGASFGEPFVLGTSRLGFAELASGSTVIVDVSNQVSKIDTRKERNLSIYQAQPQFALLTKQARGIHRMFRALTIRT